MKQFIILFFLVGILGFSHSLSIFNSNGQEVDSKNKIVYALPSERFDIGEISYWNITRYDQFIVTGLTGAGLYHKDPTNDYQITPHLAEELPVRSFDGLVWTVKLKEDLYFASGEPLTAEDVVFTYKVLLTPEINEQNFYYFGAYAFASNNSIIAIDQHTIEFTFSTVFYQSFDLLDTPIIEKNAFEETYLECLNGISLACDWSDTLGSFNKGNGPFILDEVNIHDQKLVYKKNELYLNAETILVEEVEIVYVSIATGLNKIKSGEIDILDQQFIPAGLDHSSVMTDNSSFEFIYVPIQHWQEIFLNHLHTVFGSGIDIPNNGESTNDDIQANFVRQAMNTVINRDQFLSIYGEIGGPLATPITSISRGFNKNLTTPDYSIADAKELMEKAGYSYMDIIDANGDGDYNDTGDSSFFNITFSIPHNDERRIEASNEYAKDLTRIGIKVFAKVMNFGTILNERIYSYAGQSLIPTFDDGGYDMTIVNWNFPEWNKEYYFVNMHSQSNIHKMDCVQLTQFAKIHTITRIQN